MELTNRKDTTSRLPSDNTVEIEQQNLASFADKICTDPKCRYPLLTLRIFIYAITVMDNRGSIHVSARRLSKVMDAHYDTVTKCLKYLREIGILNSER